jgi:hypothetical protein
VSCRIGTAETGPDAMSPLRAISFSLVGKEVVSFERLEIFLGDNKPVGSIQKGELVDLLQNFVLFLRRIVLGSGLSVAPSYVVVRYKARIR